MLSTLPTYISLENLPCVLQGKGIPYVFNVSDLKTPTFLHFVNEGQALTISSISLLEIDFNTLKTSKTLVTTKETVILSANVGTVIADNYLKVFGIKNTDILEADKVYIIKVIMSDLSEFYTDIFNYCSENQ